MSSAGCSFTRYAAVFRGDVFKNVLLITANHFSLCSPRLGGEVLLVFSKRDFFPRRRVWA